MPKVKLFNFPLNIPRWLFPLKRLMMFTMASLAGVGGGGDAQAQPPWAIPVCMEHILDFQAIEESNKTFLSGGGYFTHYTSGCFTHHTSGYFIHYTMAHIFSNCTGRRLCATGHLSQGGALKPRQEPTAPGCWVCQGCKPLFWCPSSTPTLQQGNQTEQKPFEFFIPTHLTNPHVARQRVFRYDGGESNQPTWKGSLVGGIWGSQ